MTDASPLLDCRDLRKRYKELTAVDGVSFHIGRGETYGLLGPNGAGKTTTISMVCGLLERDGGSVTVAGRKMDIDATDAKALIGYVPQDLAIYPDLSARENLRFFGRLQRLGGSALEARVAAILELTGLTDRANDRTEAYSGGMKRRLNIGIGLLHEPQLLVLDEPTVGVDPQSRNAILEAIEELRQGGMSILYTTHYMEEAERLCDRIGVIDAGHILAEGTRRELVALVGQLDRVLLTASVMIVLTITIFRGLLFHGVLEPLPTFLNQEKGLTVLDAGVLISIMYILGAIGEPIGGWVKDRSGARNPLIVFSLVCSGAVALLVVSTDPYLTISAMMLFGFAMFMMMSVVNTLVADVTPPEVRATFYGVSFFTRDGIGFLAPLMVGAIADASGTFITAYWVMAIFGVLTALVSVAVERPRFGYKERVTPARGAR